MKLPMISFCEEKNYLMSRIQSNPECRKMLEKKLIKKDFKESYTIDSGLFHELKDVFEIVLKFATI